jgi:hypothetical protein
MKLVGLLVFIVCSSVFASQSYSQIENQFYQMDEMRHLGKCEAIGSIESPIIVQGTDKVYKLKRVEYIFTDFLDSKSGNFAGIFEIRGITVGGSYLYGGSLTEHCRKSVGFQNYVSCGYNETAQISPITQSNKRLFVTTIFANTKPLITTFNRTQCKFWPNIGTPSKKNKIILTSVPLGRYCVSGNSDIIFKIEKTNQSVNPFRILYGNPKSTCVGTHLSAQGNYEYWMDSRNTLTGFADPETYGYSQQIDLNEDGIMDTVKIERASNHSIYGEVFNFVYYK